MLLHKKTKPPSCDIASCMPLKYTFRAMRLEKNVIHCNLELQLSIFDIVITKLYLRFREHKAFPKKFI